jgi:transposase
MPVLPAGLLVQHVLPSPNHLVIVVSLNQASAACPGCEAPSSHVHSRYERTLGDLPCQGQPVTLRVEVRRFRCPAPLCSRRTFAERLAGIAQPLARRTCRLGEQQRHVGLALGGQAGARLAAKLAMPTSPDTLLRLVRQGTPASPSPPPPRVLAVDDWAWRRGHRYGTVLVDLERNRVVDLLPDRQAETFATWLRQHPGVAVIARDRAGAYADGARQGAPDAVQVADRWHLLRNLGDAVQALADQHGGALRRAAQFTADTQATAITAHTTSSPVAPVARPSTRAQRASQAAFERRQARYEEAARLQAEGVSLSRIAALLGAERKTVRGWLRRGHAALWSKPKRGGVLASHAAFLDRRWAEGCHNAAQLWRELAALGFRGRPSTVRKWARQRRATEPHRAKAPASGWQLPSRRRVAHLLMADATTLGEAERTFVARVLEAEPALAEALAVAKRLHRVLRRDASESLADVLAAAEGTSLAHFAAHLQHDAEAVQAALELPWTTSPAEGQINRIKMLKRTMYGRAGFDLLRARVLHAA